MDRAASDTLRAEFGITEEAPTSVAAEPLATAAEMRALREALRLTRRQLALRLGCSQEAIARWESGRAKCCPRATTVGKLEPLLRRARELGLLGGDLRLQRVRPAGMPSRGRVLVEYFCTGCGALGLRRKDVTRRVTVDDGRRLVDLLHKGPTGTACGPVQLHDRRRQKPEQTTTPLDRACGLG